MHTNNTAPMLCSPSTDGEWVFSSCSCCGIPKSSAASSKDGRKRARRTYQIHKQRKRRREERQWRSEDWGEDQ